MDGYLYGTVEKGVLYLEFNCDNIKYVYAATNTKKFL